MVCAFLRSQLARYAVACKREQLRCRPAELFPMLSRLPKREMSPTPATSKRINTHLRFSGPDDGIPVVFIHGNFSSSTYWEETMLAMPKQYRCIAPDLRGYGDTEDKLIDGARGACDWSDDLKALSDVLGLRLGHLVGWSMGAAVYSTTTATKTDTPIFDTPVSIQVVPQQVLKDQQAILVKDALKNVSGVFWTGDFNYDGFQVRGFINNDFTTVYRNGLRLARAKNEIANLERIEVLKGPAAALYGRINPGGLINLVTKKPLTEPYYSLEQQFGSFDLYRTALEATGPLNADRSLLYRFDLVYKNNDTFIDFVDEERVFVAPALTWRPTERTEINLNLEYQHDEGRYYSGIPIVGRRPAPIPISRYLGFGADEDQEFATYDKILVGFDWSHRFTEDWILRQRFHYYFLDYVFNNVWFGLGVAEDGRSFTRGLDHEPAEPTHTYATNIDLTGRFETFGMNHQVLVGVDYFREDDEF